MTPSLEARRREHNSRGERATGKLELTPTFTSGPIVLPSEAREGGFDRADIVVVDVEQAGPSFDGHVFVNNPSADRETPRTPRAGYAGAFHVYGLGPAAMSSDETGVQAPITKHIIATDTIRAQARAADELTISIVPVARGAGEPAPLDVRVSIEFHRGTSRIRCSAD
jgi:hypothetical protein